MFKLLVFAFPRPGVFFHNSPTLKKAKGYTIGKLFSTILIGNMV
jgi:hypothetical protein